MHYDSDIHLWWFTVGICKQKPGYKPHDLLQCSQFILKNPLQYLLSSLNDVILTGHVIYNPAYTFKFQLKTTQVICCWIDVQRTWSHLESIFIGSEDIRKQLPVDSERFDDIDAEFKKLMAMMAKTPNVVKATNVPGKYCISSNGFLT